MLKNVHLAPAWLVQLEKKLHSLHPHPQFRLFLTMEITPRLPVNLLRAGRVFVFEPPPGVRANLLRTFSTVRLIGSNLHKKSDNLIKNLKPCALNFVDVLQYIFLLAIILN